MTPDLTKLPWCSSWICPLKIHLGLASDNEMPKMLIRIHETVPSAINMIVGVAEFHLNLPDKSAALVRVGDNFPHQGF